MKHNLWKLCAMINVISMACFCFPAKCPQEREQLLKSSFHRSAFQKFWVARLFTKWVHIFTLYLWNTSYLLGQCLRRWGLFPGRSNASGDLVIQRGHFLYHLWSWNISEVHLVWKKCVQLWLWGHFKMLKISWCKNNSEIWK